MIEVLKLEIEAKERSLLVSTSFVDKQENKFSYEKFSLSALYANHKSFVKSTKTTSCVFCGSKYSSNRSLLISETSARKKLIKQKRVCFVCLKEGHLANTCSEKYSCRKYHGRHSIAIWTFPKPGANPVINNSQLSSSNNLSDNKNNVSLQTATAQISGNFQLPKTETLNIIFDSGSQRSYITDDLCKRLKWLVIRKEKIVIKTFENVDSTFYNADIVPVQFVIDQKVIVIECLCSPFISSDLTNQSTNFVSNSYPHLKSLFLADTSPDGNKKIQTRIVQGKLQKLKKTIDYIYIPYKYKHILENYRTYHGTTTASDHKLLVTKMKSRLLQIYKNDNK